MKTRKFLLKRSVFFQLAIVCLLATLSTGCKKDVSGCTDPNSVNYNPDANIDNGLCEYARDQFLGNYAVNENCSSGNWSFNVLITESSEGFDKVILNDFGDLDVNVKAEVNDDKLSINYTEAGMTFSGSGSINGNALTIVYTVSSGGWNDNCTATYIKQ